MENTRAATGKLSHAMEETAKNTSEMIDSTRLKVAEALDKGSESLMSGAHAVEERATSAAAKLSDSASYLRDHSNREMWASCSAAFGKHPLQAMALAALGGLFVGRLVWRRSEAYDR
jgi:ElaB/YqjD/DUF883 family membrane-anchored ribosome-binding protein